MLTSRSYEHRRAMLEFCGALLLLLLLHVVPPAPAHASGCDAGASPFPPTAGAATGPFPFTGSAIPPDLMQNGSYYSGGHPETLISHGDVRARVCVRAVDGAAAAVRVELPWRRRDYNATQKEFIVRHATSGKEVAHKGTLANHSRLMGSIVFAPENGAGEYHIYFMPSNCTCMMGYCGPSVRTVYPLMRGASTLEMERWVTQHTGPGVGFLATAEFMAMQSRTAFDNFTAMELVATSAEVAHAAGSAEFLLVPGDRLQPLRLTNSSNGDFPIGWLGAAFAARTAQPVLSGNAQPGEWYALQVGVWAITVPVEVLSVAATGDEELRANFSCLSLGGNDYDGQPFTKQWYLPAGRLSALWMGVQVPQTTAKTQLNGTVVVSLRAGTRVQDVNIPLSLAVSGVAAVNSGDNDPAKLSRLRWLDSRIGISDVVPRPYTPVSSASWQANKTLHVLGRAITIGPSGMPSHIAASRVIGSNVFSIGGSWKFSEAGPRLCNQSQSSVSWVAAGSGQSGVTLKVHGTLSFEGYIDISLTLSSTSAVALPDFSVDAVLRAPYLAGLGRPGRKLGAASWPLAHIPPSGAAPSGCDINNSLPLRYTLTAAAAPMIWVGDVDGGMRIKYKGQGAEWDAPTYNAVSTWSSGGSGVIMVSNSSENSSAVDLVRISASPGPLKLAAGSSTSFHLDLCITPFKERNAVLKSHFQSRYFQIGYPDHHMYTPEEVAATGATIATIHQGVDSMINPYINWPFDPVSVELQTNFRDRFSALSNPNHTLANRFKLYYTARELTNHVAELFALRALDGEILIGNGASAAQAAAGGSTPYLLEHLVEGYFPCWQQNLGSGEFDAAVCDNGISRWSNYYLEGLRHMTENPPHTRGIYFDGINFGRNTMLRIRRTLDAATGPSAAIDFHSGNGDPQKQGAGPAIQYMHMLPFVDSLWFGESFRYNSPADYWLTEISGLPYGLASDMLGGDCTSKADCMQSSRPNPFRGMVFGMTGRYDEPTYAGRLWHLWDTIAIHNMTMSGWFDANPAVKIVYSKGDDKSSKEANKQLLPNGRGPPKQPSNWSGPYSGYFPGCAGPGPGSPPPPCKSESTLEAAERACEVLPFSECAGVTKQGTYELRQGPALSAVPGDLEVSWARNCSIDSNSCPAAIGNVIDPIYATTYVQKGARALIAIANFGLEDKNVTLVIDWAQLGLNASAVKRLRAPPLGGFNPRDPYGNKLAGKPALQVATSFPVEGLIMVEGARGWLLLIEEESTEQQKTK